MHPAPPYPVWRPPPPPVAPDGRRLAEFGDRLLARIIDGVLLSAAMMVLLVPPTVFIGWRIFESARAQADPSFHLLLLAWLGLYAGATLVAFGVSYLYEVEYCRRTGGQTFGKKVLGLRIVPLTPGEVYHRKAAAKRWLIMDVVSAILPGFVYVDGLWQLGDKPYRQCLHDRWAGTVVVKEGVRPA